MCYSISFPFLHSDGRVVHSYGRLIPHEFPITDLQQISGPDGIGRINCTDSSGRASFGTVPEILDSVEVNQRGNENSPTTSLVVNTTSVDSFKNRDMYCNDVNYYSYLFLSSKSKYTKQCSLYSYEKDITHCSTTQFSCPVI